MPDKKLTDNEIIKALECCMNGHCDDDCPFRETREHCHNLDSLILDLINRLQAENDFPSFHKSNELTIGVMSLMYLVVLLHSLNDFSNTHHRASFNSFYCLGL